jgi:hypothetical protein
MVVIYVIFFCPTQIQRPPSSPKSAVKHRDATPTPPLIRATQGTSFSRSSSLADDDSVITDDKQLEEKYQRVTQLTQHRYQ